MTHYIKILFSKSWKYSFLVFSLLMITSCDIKDHYIEGNENRKEEIRELSEFNKIEVKGNFRIKLNQGNQHQLAVSSSSNLSDYIMSEVHQQTLYISVPENMVIKDRQTIDLHIEFKNLENIKTEGNCEIKSKNKINVNNLAIVSAGASDVNLKIKSTQIDWELPGASSIYLEGEVQRMVLHSAGALKLNSQECSVDTFFIEMNGAGNAKVKVENKLKVNINGAGVLYYSGNPDKVISNIGGIGKVKRIE